MKKLLALILALVMVLGLCACTGDTGSNQGGSASGDGKVKLTVGLPTNAMVLDHENNALTKWLEEQCNVDLDFMEFAGGSEMATQISTMIGARQELPDILYGIELAGTIVSRYGKDGYFMDLSDYYADRDGASKIFWDRMENELTEDEQSQVIRKMTDAATGNIYCVPCVETSAIDSMNYTMWINQEWLDKLNLKAPTNNQELYDVLVAFRDKDPNGNGQKDEIPLFGRHKPGAAGWGGNLIDWLLNLFVYYNEARNWKVEADGTLVPVYTQDEYREALKFINKLYKDELLTSMVFTLGDGEIAPIASPANGTALCGIICAHSTGAARGSEVMYQYVPLKTWGYAVRSDNGFGMTTFITEDCENPDKAFEMLMTLWSWEGSVRVRYGEFGVNWTYPDEGAKSELGLEATYKLIQDPLQVQGTAKWSMIASTLNYHAEGESAQASEDMDEWGKKKLALNAEASRLFDEAAKENNKPEEICPYSPHTEEENNSTSVERANVEDYYQKAQADFCTGRLDPNKDSDWNAYLKELDSLGLDVYQKYMQVAYDRTK